MNRGIVGTIRLVALLSTIALTACGLPRSGPTKNEILSSADAQTGDAVVVAVDQRIAEVTEVSPALGFSQEFLAAGRVGADTIRPGDTLSLAIWENVDDGLLAAEGTNQTVLEELQVDSSGFIFVPYAGRIRAAGNTPEAIRRAVTEQLDEQTPDPQVSVRRVAGDGASVTVTGAVGAQGVYAIERPTRTLTAMLAQAGGLVIEPEIAQITVYRGDRSSTIWFQDLFRQGASDIALRDGDRILVEEDTRTFTALGATGAQAQVSFDKQTLSALDALAQVGGLNPSIADPTGIFVFRDEPPEIAGRVLGRAGITTSQRMIYLLDLTEAGGVFVARNFGIRDGDTVYVTEAPFAQWSKTLGAITGTASSATALASLAPET